MQNRSLTLEELLCFSLYSANNAMGRVYRPILGKLGLTYPQYIVLTALWQQDKRRVNDLGSDLGLETNTLTPLLKRLEANGLVSRDRDSKDERSVIVSLTEKGRDLEAAAADISNCVLTAAGLPISELDDLRDKIKSLAETLTKAAR